MDRTEFTQRVAERVLIGDGAMGTMLYQQGVFVNRCFDELNLTDAGLVGHVHAGYVEAGVDFVETNTFGANRVKLSRYGLAREVERINRAGVDIARAAAGDDVLVAGAMGPLGCELTEYGPMTHDQAGRAFAQQGSALLEGGVDLLILETFSNTEELLIALDAVGGLADVPIIAQMTVFAEISLVLLIGLLFDMLNTWLTNAGIIKWYAIKRGIR